LVVALITLGGIATIAACGGDDAEGLEQTQPVQVRGSELPSHEDEVPDPALGRAAPTIAGSSFDGSEVRVRLGQPTLLVFLAHWCPVCQAEVPSLVSWETSGMVPDGLEVIGVATATSRGQPNYPPSSWLEEEGFPFPVLADDDANSAATAMGLSAYPYFVLLDEDGRVLDRGTGAQDPAAFTARLEDALG
jgi:thiol-disulfide isomerase/thioredoxin